MYQRDCGAVILALQIRIKGTKLFYQEHSFISNRSGGKRYYIGILCTLFKNSSYDIQLPVKINALFCLCRFPDKSLHNIWHTVDRSLSEYIRYGRNHTPSPEFESFLFYDDFKHLLALVSF